MGEIHTSNILRPSKDSENRGVELEEEEEKEKEEEEEIIYGAPSRKSQERLQRHKDTLNSVGVYRLVTSGLGSSD